MLCYGSAQGLLPAKSELSLLRGQALGLCMASEAALIVADTVYIKLHSQRLVY